MRLVEEVHTDGAQLDWAYETPMSAPERRERAPLDLCTISPAMARRREESATPPPRLEARRTADLPVPVDAPWEQAGYLVFVGGIGSLATAGALMLVAGAWFLIT